jgi:hypothetical protein
VTTTATKSLDEAAIDYERAKRRARRVLDAEEAPPHEPLRALSIGELYARPKPGWRVDQVLPDGALAELVGDSESLKSFIAIHMGLCIASGRADFFNYKVKQGPVLYIAAEGGGAFQFRLRAWAHYHGVDIREMPFWTIVAPVNLRDVGFQNELREIVRDKKPVLIVVDTLHRCIPGAEENSSRDLGEVVGFATRLQSESGSAVLFLHHPPKGDRNGRGRGSGALYYAADTELSSVIEGEENDDGSKVVKLAVKKQKDDSKVSLTLTNRIVPVFNEHGDAMANEFGRAITSCILELATDEDIEAANSSNDDLESLVLAYVRANPDQTTDQIREGVNRGKTNVAKALNKLCAEKHLTKRAVKGGRATKQVYSITAQPPLPTAPDPGM